MSISNEKAYHHGSLRSALIEAAVAALQDDGVEALSLRKLASKIGVSHNAPYMHFDDKEALLAAVAEEGFKLLAQTIGAALAAAHDSWYERFENGCVAYVVFMLEHFAHAQVMFRDYDAQKYPTFPAAAASALRLLDSLIQEGQAAGLVAAGDSRQWATLTWSLLHGISMIIGADKKSPPVMGDQTPDELTRQSVRSLYLGLQPRAVSTSS